MVSIIGKTFTDISGMSSGSYDVLFKDSEGVEYAMYHAQDCCETVELNEVIGDPDDLLNTPILFYEKVQNADGPELADKYNSETWTFYSFRTIKGSVTLRWHGESNGYYSEEVDFKMKEARKRPYEWEGVE